MEVFPQIIKGGSHTDERGTICFQNDFDMSAIKRFYVIKHLSSEVERGWRGHKIEQRWFYVVKGIFRISIVKIDDWTNPSETLDKK
ncbi:MAG: sugar epimerase, partial [Flavobacterium sp.]